MNKPELAASVRKVFVLALSLFQAVYWKEQFRESNFLNENVLAVENLLIILSIASRHFAGSTGGRKLILPAVSFYKSIENNYSLYYRPGQNFTVSSIIRSTKRSLRSWIFWIRIYLPFRSFLGNGGNLLNGQLIRRY